MAFVYDERNNFENFVNPASVIWQSVETDYWKKFLRENLQDAFHKERVLKKLKKI